MHKIITHVFLLARNGVLLLVLPGEGPKAPQRVGLRRGAVGGLGQLAPDDPLGVAGPSAAEALDVGDVGHGSIGVDGADGNVLVGVGVAVAGEEAADLGGEGLALAEAAALLRWGGFTILQLKCEWTNPTLFAPDPSPKMSTKTTQLTVIRCM